MAYDAARERVVLFGGFDGSRGLTDTWLWNGNEWNLASSVPEVTPRALLARQYSAMAYDAARGEIVLTGGRHVVIDDTWLWNGTAWTTGPLHGPGESRERHAMAYDFARERVVLFGGVNGTRKLGDTWLWDGATWTVAAPTDPILGPDRRKGVAMAYDAARERVVLFGGFGDTLKSDTWLWDGTGWNKAPADGPSARYLHSMAYEEVDPKNWTSEQESIR